MQIRVDADVVEELGSAGDAAGVWVFAIAKVVGHTPWKGLVPYAQDESCQEDPSNCVSSRTNR